MARTTEAFLKIAFALILLFTACSENKTQNPIEDNIRDAWYLIGFIQADGTQEYLSVHDSIKIDFIDNENFEGSSKGFTANRYNGSYTFRPPDTLIIDEIRFLTYEESYQSLYWRFIDILRKVKYYELDESLHLYADSTSRKLWFSRKPLAGDAW